MTFQPPPKPKPKPPPPPTPSELPPHHPTTKEVGTRKKPYKPRPHLWKFARKPKKPPKPANRTRPSKFRLQKFYLALLDSLIPTLLGTPGFRPSRSAAIKQAILHLAMAKGIPPPPGLDPDAHGE